MLGKNLRTRHIQDSRTGKFLLVPMDHGITLGPVKGLRDIERTITAVKAGGASGVVVHKGILPRLVGLDLHGLGLVVHLSASTTLNPDKYLKVNVSSVETAMSLGADAISTHTNFGNESESDMLADLGEVADVCHSFGLPLLAMVYARGPAVKNAFDVGVVSHLARVAEETGADIIKTVYTGDVETYREVVEGVRAPVIIAGGDKVDSDEALLKMVEGSLQAGGAGVSVGRNIFQHQDPEAITRQVYGLFHKNT